MAHRIKRLATPALGHFSGLIRWNVEQTTESNKEASWGKTERLGRHNFFFTNVLHTF